MRSAREIDVSAVTRGREDRLRICLVHSGRVAREVLARALATRLGAEVDTCCCCEDVLAQPLNYDAFVVYNNFRRRMNGIRCVAEIRTRKPSALIVGVSTAPGTARRFPQAGADAYVLRSGNEVKELVEILRREEGKRRKTTQ